MFKVGDRVELIVDVWAWTGPVFKVLEKGSRGVIIGPVGGVHLYHVTFDDSGWCVLIGVEQMQRLITSDPVDAMAALYKQACADRDSYGKQLREAYREIEQLRVLAAGRSHSLQLEQAGHKMMHAQRDAAYAALDAVVELAQQLQSQQYERLAGDELLALLLKHGVHPK